MHKRSLSLVLYGRKTRMTGVAVVSTLKADDVIFTSKDGVGSPMKPTCCLCFKPYCPDLMYIHCERCRNAADVEGGHYRNILIQIVVIIKVQNQNPLSKKIPLICSQVRKLLAQQMTTHCLLCLEELNQL